MEAQTQVQLVSLHFGRGGQAWPHFNSSYIGAGSSRSKREREIMGVEAVKGTDLPKAN